MVQQELEELRLREKSLVESIRRRIRSECKVVYLPVPMANAKVDYILVAMEPSFGHWAEDDEKKAEEKVRKGFRSFIKSWDDFAFLYAVETFLSPSHYVTDVSKAAMLVGKANKHRSDIWPEWLKRLKEEIEIVGKDGCRIWFVGKKTHAFLKNEKLPREVIGTPLLHYSAQAARERKKRARRDIAAYVAFRRKFRHLLTSEAVLAFAERYMEEHDVPPTTRAEILEGLDSSKAKLNGSRKQLIYAYYHDFVLVEKQQGCNGAALQSFMK